MKAKSKTDFDLFNVRQSELTETSDLVVLVVAFGGHEFRFELEEFPKYMNFAISNIAIERIVRHSSCCRESDEMRIVIGENNEPSPVYIRNLQDLFSLWNSLSLSTVNSLVVVRVSVVRLSWGSRFGS